jgi:hypothetical protein
MFVLTSINSAGFVILVPLLTLPEPSSDKRFMYYEVKASIAT